MYWSYLSYLRRPTHASFYDQPINHSPSVRVKKIYSKITRLNTIQYVWLSLVQNFKYLPYFICYYYLLSEIIEWYLRKFCPLAGRKNNLQHCVNSFCSIFPHTQFWFIYLILTVICNIHRGLLRAQRLLFASLTHGLLNLSNANDTVRCFAHHERFDQQSL